MTDKQQQMIIEQLDRVDVSNFTLETETTQLNGDTVVVRVTATWEVPTDEVIDDYQEVTYKHEVRTDG